MMKFLMLSVLTLLTFGGDAAAAIIKPQDKVLVVYYSKTGNTKEIAGQIRTLSGGDLVAIEPVEAYPENDSQLVAQAKKEINEGYKPALKTTVDNFAEYDVIFIGSPCWWGTVASPVASFLAQNDFFRQKSYSVHDPWRQRLGTQHERHQSRTSRRGSS